MSKAFPLLCLLMFLASFAVGQTTFNIQPTSVHVTGGHGYLTAYELQLTDPATGENAGSIPEIWGGTNSCGVGSGTPANLGFSYLTIGSTAYGCIDATSYQESGSKTVGVCKGAAQGVEKIAGDVSATITVHFSYFRGRYGCYTSITGGTVKVN